jgi:hypothetical protein
MAGRLLLLVGAGVVALVLSATGAADVGLILRQAVVSTGDRMTVWGPCDRMPVYLVRESYARRVGFYYDSLRLGRAPTSSAFRFLGRMVCTGRMHYIGDMSHYPSGDWSSWNGYLSFRVPRLPHGRYQLVVYCDPCHRGRGGTLVVSNWLWQGSKRIGRAAVIVRP